MKTLVAVEAELRSDLFSPSSSPDAWCPEQGSRSVVSLPCTLFGQSIWRVTLTDQVHQFFCCRRRSALSAFPCFYRAAGYAQDLRKRFLSHIQGCSDPRRIHYRERPFSHDRARCRLALFIGHRSRLFPQNSGGKRPRTYKKPPQKERSRVICAFYLQPRQNVAASVCSITSRWCRRWRSRPWCWCSRWTRRAGACRRGRARSAPGCRPHRSRRRRASSPPRWRGGP